MEILLTNPTRKEIVEAVEKAEHAANNGARARTAHFGLVDGKPVHDLVVTTKSGLVQRDGIGTYLDGRESATVAELVQVIKSDDFPSCTRPEAVAAILKAVARAKRERRVPVTI